MLHYRSLLLVLLKLILLYQLTSSSNNVAMAGGKVKTRNIETPRVVLSVSLHDCISCISELSVWNEFHRIYGKIIHFTLYIRTERRDDIPSKFKKEFDFGFDVILDNKGEITQNLGFSKSPSV
jgi:hypothetical protein